MAKAASKKIIGRKLKKTVRRSLAAVLMLTAIGTAAIPVPEIEAATVYPATVTNEVISNDGVDLAATGSPTIEKALTIRQMSDGTWQLDWQYEFYMQLVSGAQRGVISKYNSVYQSNTVTLNPNVTYQYYKVPEATYNALYATPVTKTLSHPTSNPNALDDYEFYQKYFPSEYQTFKTAYTNYEALYAAWLPTSIPPAPTPPVPLSKTTDNLSADQKLQYYCDTYTPDSGVTYPMKGFKLASVIDASAGTTTNVNVYIPKDGTTGTRDSNGFLVKAQSQIIAIGNNAFANTMNVDILNLPSEIKYIGDSAFENSFIKSVNFVNVSNIGNRAFKNCKSLSAVSLGAGTFIIGAEAFYGAGITSITFPNSVSRIGMGAFAYCKDMKTADLSAISQAVCTLGDFAFYDCYALDSVSFGGASITGIGEACFAVATGVTGNLTEFVFPSQLPSATELEDYTLSGRTNLKKVIMPSNFGRSTAAVVPPNTFENCLNLENVEFPDDGNASCGLASYAATLFDDVINPKFYVRGPELDRVSAVASPRKSTWSAKTKVLNAVPYVYKKNGVDYYEVSDGKYLLLVNGNGELVSCKLVDETSILPIDLTIPSKVGEYDVTSILDGCFGDKVKGLLRTLVIEDDSINTIADGVFENCEKLESVTIGNSVTSVGANAFGNCDSLTQVYFHTPPSYSGFTIGAGAFETGSSELTFHGDIVVGYAPFEFATDAANYVNSNTGKRICYRSNAPSNLMVMLDNTNKKVTLIDYPHYEEIDIDNAAYCDEMQAYYLALYPTEYTATAYSIIDKYENIYLDKITPTKPWEMLSEAETQIVNATMNLAIPAGIQSIDAKEFLNASENAANVSYLTGSLGTGSVSKNSVYATTTTVGTTSGTPGLFSGNIADYTPVNVDYEKSIWGNDRLLSISMTDVEYFPDYAFESCERLESIDIGSCTDIGTAPFSGCDSLQNITSNTKYQTANGIIYSVNTDGTLNIVECLSARGDLIEPRTIALDSDPLLANVSTIEDGAFKNCDEITIVDLSSATKLKTIPEYCFNNCDSLARVILPSSVNKILDQAFTQNQKALSVTIPGKEVQITKDAFTPKQGEIRTYEDSAAYTYAKIYGIGTDIIGTLFKVSFLNYDGTEIIADQFVEDGKDAEAPETNPIRTGYTFTGWSKSYKDIAADTVIVALYKLNATTSGNNTGGTGTGTGTGTSTSSNSTATSAIWYKVTVTGGSGSGYYKAGTIVGVNAYATSDGKVFDKWTSTSNGVGFTNVNGASTTFTMPTNDVAVVANYKVATATKLTATSNNTVKSSGSSSGSTSGNKTSTGNSTGTVISITKPGFSNTDVASAIVNGSTDNYVIKVIESTEAQAAIEAALLADAETLENIKYFPMDISLYDSTGTTKITNTEGITIDITLPIPDELIEYAGNNKVAGVVDGKLDKLQPTFKTIDGVACVTFTATHFSPYTIYVDTANLTAGTLDSSPTTGDGIHPKWFLAIGLACLSVVLFVKKDKVTVNTKLA